MNAKNKVYDTDFMQRSVYIMKLLWVTFMFICANLNGQDCANLRVDNSSSHYSRWQT